MGGLIFGMVRVLVNWCGLYMGGAYIRRFTVCNVTLHILNIYSSKEPVYVTSRYHPVLRAEPYM